MNQLPAAMRTTVCLSMSKVLMLMVAVEMTIHQQGKEIAAVDVRNRRPIQHMGWLSFFSLSACALLDVMR